MLAFELKSTDLQSKISVHEQGEALELCADEALLAGRRETHDANRVFPAIFVQQLAVPFVHLQVLVQVLEYQHPVTAFVEVRQHRQGFAGNLQFVPESVTVLSLVKIT